jgi:hypothetical protein
MTIRRRSDPDPGSWSVSILGCFIANLHVEEQVVASLIGRDLAGQCFAVPITISIICTDGEQLKASRIC